MRRPRPRFFDLSRVIIGAIADKPSQTGRAVPQVSIAHRRARYQGQCARCGGAHVIFSQPTGITLPCPECTGYQK